MARTFTLDEATDRYLKERKANVSDQTLYNHRSSLRMFKRFCKEEGIKIANDIDSFVVSDFRLNRMEEVSKITVKNNLSAVKTFLRWCEGHNLLDDTISESVTMPELENVSRHETISEDEIEQILSYLDNYEYATLKHSLFALLWDTGIRVGAARALDVEDFCADGHYIKLRHRPELGVPLKNGKQSEREVNLNKWVAEIIKDYIDARREQVQGDHGNKPLFSTRHGRAHQTTLRGHIVSLTRPCEYGNECPHDRKIAECEANSYTSATKCPSTVSPHPIRRSAIMHWLDKGHRKELLSDRMDVSADVLEKHYDARSKEQKRELRKEMLDIE